MSEEIIKEKPKRSPISVGDLHQLDVADDQSVINVVQKHRVAFIDTIAPNGELENPKDKYIFMAALKDLADSAQSRITSKQKAESGERDRELIQQVLGQIRTGNVIDVNGSDNTVVEGTIPTPTARLTTREIDPAIMDKAEQKETYDEFRTRMAGKVDVDEDLPDD